MDFEIGGTSESPIVLLDDVQKIIKYNRLDKILKKQKDIFPVIQNSKNYLKISDVQKLQKKSRSKKENFNLFFKIINPLIKKKFEKKFDLNFNISSENKSEEIIPGIEEIEEDYFQNGEVFKTELKAMSNKAKQIKLQDIALLNGLCLTAEQLKRFDRELWTQIYFKLGEKRQIAFEDAISSTKKTKQVSVHYYTACDWRFAESILRELKF